MADYSEPWRKPKRTSWIPRILAPLALVAVVIAVFVIVNGSIGDDSGGGDTTTKTTEKKGEIPKKYVVQPGDSISSIAEEFDISTDRIQRLNPDVDPQALNAGQVLKLH
jgi:LysM repeat protein